ncbi:MAG: hypothetical protein I8H75_06085 [Myxococcaceae bacterium]|nr:hypothetical protein [Myxococcaceae bacterium]MBH2006885.1 hypothetical protein [Myxococcaceae bacterium]
MPISPVIPGVQQTTELVKNLSKSSYPEVGTQTFSSVLKKQGELKVLSQPNGSLALPASKLQKTPSALKSLFDHWSKDQSSMSKIMKVAMSGQNFTPSQLLLLQHATYQVTFELQTMSKLVEQASSAIKTTLQTQV